MSTLAQQAWYQKNKERISAYGRKRLANPEVRLRAVKRSKEWYQENRSDILNAQKEGRNEHRLFLAWLKSLPCVDCGNTFPPPAMQFDHRVGATKRFNIGQWGGSHNMKLSALQSEVMKCDLVCANCHAVRTWMPDGRD